MSVFGGVFRVCDLDRWTEKRSMFGVYDNIGILGDFHKNMNVFSIDNNQKCFSKRMLTEDKHSLDKRISFLYRRFNRYGKHR
uniref:Large ribosomal subunit protein mL51 n=1 Tax=Sinocyclocheilus anshuiensis TaxID=1608454 RepID=A0A671RCG8_9TELE